MTMILLLNLTPTLFSMVSPTLVLECWGPQKCAGWPLWYTISPYSCMYALQHTHTHTHTHTIHSHVHTYTTYTCMHTLTHAHLTHARTHTHYKLRITGVMTTQMRTSGRKRKGRGQNPVALMMTSALTRYTEGEQCLWHWTMVSVNGEIVSIGISLVPNVDCRLVPWILIVAICGMP